MVRKKGITDVHSYDAMPESIDRMPDFRARKGYPILSREEFWREIELVQGTTNLGYGPAQIFGKDVRGFYFQSNMGAAEDLNKNLGLMIWKCGDLLFFAPDPNWMAIHGRQGAQKMSTLRSRLINAAWENPSLRPQILPLLKEGKKAARFPDPERDPDAAIYRADDLMKDLNLRLRDMHQNLKKAERALNRENWDELERLGFLSREEKNFLAETKALYSW